VKLHTYVIVTDAGCAPNYDRPCTTLAVCKPRIRRKAEKGDVVLAFTGRAISREPHAVCWAGQVKEKLTFAEYWGDSRFRKKRSGASRTPDNFYRPLAGGGFIQVENPVHGPKSARRDLGGLYVLTFNPVWRFGASGPVLPTEYGYRISRTGRRGERIHELTVHAWRALRKWLDRQLELKPARETRVDLCEPGIRRRLRRPCAGETP